MPNGQTEGQIKIIAWYVQQWTITFTSAFRFLPTINEHSYNIKHDCILIAIVHFLLYTLFPKRNNFSEVAFLLGRSLGQWNLGQMKNDPSFHSYTLFPKRNATIKKIAEFALAAMGFQLFCENHGKMCTQIIEYTEITVWYLSTGSFACYSQEHFPWWTWPGVTDPGPGSPQKIMKLKLLFFWGRVYSWNRHR